MNNVLSFSGGVESTCLALMSRHGLVNIDYALFCDTGWESKDTYNNIEYVRNLVDFEIITISIGSIKDHAYEFLAGNRTRIASIPFFMGNQDRGKMRRQCTMEYKLDPIWKYVKDRYDIPERYKGDPVVNMLIGVNMDEWITRAKISRKRYIQNEYPLVDMQKTRLDCVRWLEKNGYTVPEKSACIGCPMRKSSEWARMKNQNPKEFKEAVDFEKAMKKHPGFKHEPFLHRSLQNLDQVIFENPDQVEFGFEEECEGLCGI